MSHDDNLNMKDIEAKAFNATKITRRVHNTLLHKTNKISSAEDLAKIIEDC